MNTRERIHNLELIYEVCCAEMYKLQTSITTFLDESSKIYKFICDQLGSNMGSDMVTLIAYDDYSTKLSTLTDMTRKFNLHLYFQEMQQKKDMASVCDRMNCLNCEDEKPLAVEEVDQRPLFLYQKPSIDHFEVNAAIDACVTYVDRVSLKFSICEIQNPLISTLINLQQTLNGNCKPFDGIPDPMEVFGLVIDNQLLRAVRENTNEVRQSYLAYLLEFGEITQLNSVSEMFHLPQRYRDIPAQAVQCELVSVNGDADRDLREALLKYECTKAKFTLVRKDDSILYMNLEEDDGTVDLPTNPPEIRSVDLPVKQETNPFKCTYPDEEAAVTDNNGLTAEEIKELYEEPIQTTNAMKAIMGYDPKDDARICKFYNPVTKGCFKGNNCRLLHTQVIKDGWTKDEEATLLEVCVPMAFPKSGSITRVIPTHIVDVCSFYAQMEFSERNDNPLFWSSREIPDKTKLKRAPLQFDMVLAQFSDGNWYRAQVMDCFEDNTFRVFYIDYGNEDVVSISALAAWNKSLSTYSFQAFKCRIAGIANATRNKVDEDNALKIVAGMILDQFVTVRVLHSTDEILVELVDENCAKLPEILVWQRYAHEVDKIL